MSGRAIALVLVSVTLLGYALASDPSEAKAAPAKVEARGKAKTAKCKMSLLDTSGGTHTDSDAIDGGTGLLGDSQQLRNEFKCVAQLDHSMIGKGKQLAMKKLAALKKKAMLKHAFSLGEMLLDIANCVKSGTGLTVMVTLKFRKDGNAAEKFLYKIFSNAVFHFSAVLRVTDIERKFTGCMPLTNSVKISATWTFLDTKLCYEYVEEKQDANALERLSSGTRALARGIITSDTKANQDAEANTWETTTSLTLTGGMQYNLDSGDKLDFICALTFEADFAQIGLALEGL